MQFQSWLKSRLANPADVTRWPTWFARLFMPPCEIVVAARKKRNIGEPTLPQTTAKSADVADTPT